jgi:nicotinamidase-related amidase
MKDIALLVVDVQKGLIGGHPYREIELLEEIRALTERARANGVEVVYVRHCEDEGPFMPGTATWQVHPAIAPLEGERVFDKRFNSAFKDTGLDEYLRGKGVKALVVSGMQTEYCIDATIKSAFEHGYRVVMPKGGSTTFDNRLASADRLVDFYEEDIWSGEFADVLPLDGALALLK